MLILFLAIMGPGIITANVDNDAGGITTYSVAGASFGLKLLWIFIPMTVALIVVQEMCARMGAVTGKGLSDLIRERFGVKIIIFVMMALILADLGNTVSEFAGVAASGEIFSISQVHPRAARRLPGLVDRDQGFLQDSGADLPGGIRHLPVSTSPRRSWPSPTGVRCSRKW